MRFFYGKCFKTCLVAISWPLSQGCWLLDISYMKNCYKSISNFVTLRKDEKHNLIGDVLPIRWGLDAKNAALLFSILNSTPICTHMFKFWGLQVCAEVNIWRHWFHTSYAVQGVFALSSLLNSGRIESDTMAQHWRTIVYRYVNVISLDSSSNHLQTPVRTKHRPWNPI